VSMTSALASRRLLLEIACFQVMPAVSHRASGRHGVAQ
jgi:hypothetical protein